MALTGSTHWKEEFHIHDENDRTFCFSCGWGVEPPVAYLPSEADWQRCTPVWLHDRRDGACWLWSFAEGMRFIESNEPVLGGDGLDDAEKPKLLGP